MHRGPGDPHPRLDHRPVHPHPVHPPSPEGREEGGVHVQHPPVEARDDLRRDQLQPAREDHQVDPLQRLRQPFAEPVGAQRAGVHDPRRDPRALRPLQRADPGAGADDPFDEHPALAAPEAVEQRLQVAAPARGEDRDARGRVHGLGRLGVDGGGEDRKRALARQPRLRGAPPAPAAPERRG